MLSRGEVTKHLFETVHPGRRPIGVTKDPCRKRGVGRGRCATGPGSDPSGSRTTEVFANRAIRSSRNFPSPYCRKIRIGSRIPLNIKFLLNRDFSAATGVGPLDYRQFNCQNRYCGLQQLTMAGFITTTDLCGFEFEAWSPENEEELTFPLISTVESIHSRDQALEEGSITSSTGQVDERMPMAGFVEVQPMKWALGVTFRQRSDAGPYSLNGVGAIHALVELDPGSFFRRGRI